MSRKRNENKVRKKQIRYYGTNNFMPHSNEFNFSDYCKKMPPVQREISNKQRDKVYIRQECYLYMTLPSIANFSAVERKWLIAKWQKSGQIAGEAFLPEQVGQKRLVSNIFNLSAVAVLGGEKRFEKVFHVHVGNKSLDEVRTQYHVNGMNAINRVMRTLKQHSGWLI